MDGQIDNKVKAARLNELNAMQTLLARELNENYVGRKFEILVDGTAPIGEGLLQGRTQTDKVVIIKGGPEYMGRYIDVNIVRASHWSLEGEII
jgi:tRNA-2-methylthio-N6-dimethylallyladenosine synthase